MRFFMLSLSLIALVGLSACDSTTDSHAVYNSLPLCPTDLKPALTPSNPTVDTSCQLGHPASELYDRDMGVLPPYKGVGVAVREVADGLTGENNGQ